MEGIKKEYEEAADIYKSNCDERNWPRSCAKFAGYKSVGNYFLFHLLYFLYSK